MKCYFSSSHGQETETIYRSLILSQSCKSVFDFYFKCSLADRTYRQRQRKLFVVKWLWAPLWTEAGRIERRIERELALVAIRDSLIGKYQPGPVPAIMYVVERPPLPEVAEETAEPTPNGSTRTVVGQDPPADVVYDVLRVPRSESWHFLGQIYRSRESD